jgi:ComF family protein
MFAGAQRTVNLDRPGKSTLRRLLGAAASVIAPPQCVLCDQPGLAGPVDLCGACLAGLPRPTGAALIPGGDFALACCPWSFDFPVDALVRALKFRGERCHARLFGTLLARERAHHEAPWPGVVIPVPLHPLRLRARGYNQAAEIARYAARELGLPLDRNALRRLRPTREQSALRSRDRAANVAGAFGATRALAGLRVALVDDVVTTGSTVNAAAAALREAGAAEVELWVVARATRRMPGVPRSPSGCPEISAAG